MNSFKNSTISSVTARIALAVTALALAGAALLVTGCGLYDSARQQVVGDTADSGSIIFVGVGRGRGDQAMDQSSQAARDRIAGNDQMDGKLGYGDTVIVDSLRLDRLSQGSQLKVRFPTRSFDDQPWRIDKEMKEKKGQVNAELDAVYAIKDDRAPDPISFLLHCSTVIKESANPTGTIYLITDGTGVGSFDINRILSGDVSYIDQKISAEQAAGSLPDLAGFDVRIVNQGSSEKCTVNCTASEYYALESFWNRYLSACGSRLASYGPLGAEF